MGVSKKASLVLYMPVSFEPEDIALRPLDSVGADGLFAHRQWRTVAEFLEVTLGRHPNCINNPWHARLANNKLVQAEVLKRAGAPALSLRPADVIPDGPKDGELVCKNLSEGARKSSTEFSNTRLVQGPGERLDYPLIFQRYIAADHEMRFYVFDNEILPIRIRRRLADGLVDVRAMPLAEADIEISFDYSAFHPQIVAASRALGLSYAAIDAIPENGELLILEINANGVWWMLPAPIQEHVRSAFHRFLYRRLLGGQAAVSSASPTKESLQRRSSPDR
jgi:hypothetical protein